MKEDKIPLIVDVESSKAQQAIRELEKDSKNLREENKARMNQMLALEKAGKAETEAYKNLAKEYDKTRKKISANSKAIADHTKKISINCLTMAQLKSEARQLQCQMDNTAKALNPEAYDALESRLKVVKQRMSELQEQATSWRDTLKNDQTQSFLVGTATERSRVTIKGTGHDQGDRSLIFYFERGRESGVRATSVFRARLIP